MPLQAPKSVIWRDFDANLANCGQAHLRLGWNQATRVVGLVWIKSG